MCTKTKTSWGCGCSTKDNEPVPCKTAKRLRSACTDYERYHFKRDGDCRKCRDSSDPIGRGMRGEGRYAQEIKRERKRENDRGRNPQPRERTQPTRKERPSNTDYDGPEEITYEYNWDSPSTNGRRRRSRTKDEDVDDVIDLTPPEAESRDRRRRDRRSSFPSDYGSPPGLGRAEYERSRDEYYQNKGPSRHDNRHRRRHNSLDYEFDHDDLGFDYELSPRLGSRMSSGFSMFPGGRDPFKSSFFTKRTDDFFDDSFFRY